MSRYYFKSGTNISGISLFGSKYFPYISDIPGSYFFTGTGRSFVPPADFEPTLPCNIYRDNSNQVDHDMDFTRYTEGYDEIFVDYDTGNNTSGDGTESSPYKTIAKVLNDISLGAEGNYIITVLSTTVLYRDEFRPANRTFNNKSITIRPKVNTDRVTITSAQRGLSWSTDDNVFVTTRSLTYIIYDLRVTDDNDVPIPYTNVTTLAECKATAKTWYTNGTQVYVNTVNGLTPTSDILVCITQLFEFTLTGNSKMYFENMNFYNNGVVIIGNKTGVPSGEFCANNSVFVGGSYLSVVDIGNTLFLDNVKNTYLFDCKVAYSRRDAISYYYDKITNPRECLGLEFNCETYAAGLINQSDTNNASTVHNGGTCLRINGNYHTSKGPVIIDIDGSYSFLIDCNSRDSVNNNAVYEFYNTLNNPSGVLAKAVLVYCRNEFETMDSPQLYISDSNVDATLYINNLPNLKSGSETPVFIE